MKKMIFILCLSVSGVIGQEQNISEITINVLEGRVIFKGDKATFIGTNKFMTQEKIKSRKKDIVEVFWSADGVSRCYNLKSRTLVGC